MAGPSVRLEGVPEVDRAMDRLGEDAKDVRAPSEELGRRGKDETLRVVPRLTGTLAGSIEYRVDEHGVELGAGEAYAPFPEFGTRWQLAQLYLTRGFEEMSRDAPEVYNAWLERELRKVGG